MSSLWPILCVCRVPAKDACTTVDPDTRTHTTSISSPRHAQAVLAIVDEHKGLLDAGARAALQALATVHGWIEGLLLKRFYELVRGW